jgi:hypothetical protein
MVKKSPPDNFARSNPAGQRQSMADALGTQ